MKNPIIYRYVTQAWLKIVSFFKTIFNAKSSDGKVGGKLHLEGATKFDRISQKSPSEFTKKEWKIFMAKKEMEIIERLKRFA